MQPRGDAAPTSGRVVQRPSRSRTGAGDGEVHAGPVPLPRDPDSRAAAPSPAPCCGTAPVPGERELATFARRAWKLDEREYQYAACDVIAAYVGLCSERLLADLRFLVTHKSWWDTVDALAPSVGALVLAHPQLRTELDSWIGDDNIWLARVALLHQLRFKTHTDSGRLFRYCRQRATDDEFFLRKAIGWAFREYSKTDAAAVRRFVAANADRLVADVASRSIALARPPRARALTDASALAPFRPL